MSHLAGRLTVGRRILMPKTPSADPPYNVGDEPWAFETPDVHDRYIAPSSLRMTNLFEVLWARTTQRWLTYVSWIVGLELHFACI